jgi:hypothetical protein
MNEDTHSRHATSSSIDSHRGILVASVLTFTSGWITAQIWATTWARNLFPTEGPAAAATARLQAALNESECRLLEARARAVNHPGDGAAYLGVASWEMRRRDLL